jgi:hypothetical protein
VLGALALSVTACTTTSPAPAPSATELDASVSGSVDCATGRDPKAVRGEEVVSFTDGVATPDWFPGSAPPNPADPAERTEIPADFEAVAAIRCVEGWDVGSGFLGYAQERYVNEVPELVQALSDPAPPAAAQGCAQYYDPQPNIWLLDAAGEAILPRWPVDACDHLTGPLPSEILPPGEGEPTTSDQHAFS